MECLAEVSCFGIFTSVSLLVPTIVPSHAACSGLNSAAGLVTVGGDLVAVPHYVKATGYKAKNAYGAKPVFKGETYVGFIEGLSNDLPNSNNLAAQLSGRV